MSELKRTPPYLQIAEKLLAQITSGQLAPGERVPSLRELAKAYGVSPVTAGKALGWLQTEGYVTVPGKGLATIVRDQAEVHRTGADRARSVRRTGRIYTDGEYARITSAEVVPAPADVATGLGLAEGANAIRRIRVTYTSDGQPVSTSVSWLDGALAVTAPALTIPDRIKQGSWRYVEERTGKEAIRGRDEISSRLATEEEAELLGLDLPAAVRVATSRIWTDDGDVIEYGVSVAGGNRASAYEYDL